MVLARSRRFWFRLAAAGAIVAAATGLCGIACRQGEPPSRRADAKWFASSSRTSSAASARADTLSGTASDVQAEAGATGAPEASARSLAASAGSPVEQRFSVDDAILSMDRDGRKTRIADGVEGFWPVRIEERSDAGRATLQAVAYAKAGGAGGYENEGQALYLWAPGDRESRKVLVEYLQIQRVEARQARSGRSVLVIVMIDGGLGALHLALADPHRGEVFRADGAVVVGGEDGTIRIGWFRDEDWDALGQDAAVRPRPLRTQRIDLDAILGGPVIHNSRRP